MNTDFNTCHWHPNQKAGVICQRCERRICVNCMHTASVGFHCPDCVSPSSLLVSNRLRRRPTGQVFGDGGLAVHSSQSFITRILIAFNFGAFLMTLITGGSLASGGGDLTIDYGLVGYGRVRNGLLIDHVGVAENEWWRIVTSAFLHGGIIHLAFNMFLLWVLGSMLEKVHGSSRYLSIFFGSLATGSLGVMLLDPLALTIGASGAVFGLMGSTVTFQIRRGVNPWSSGIGSLLALNLVFTFIRPNISIGGHIGGLIGGLILGWMYDEIDLRRLPRFIGALISWVYVTVCVVVTIWAAGRWWDPVLG